MKKIIWSLSFMLLFTPLFLSSDDGQSNILEFNESTAQRFVDLALNCISKEYPNKISHVLNGDKDVKNPRILHPAFYGCFDWHSAVHGHWALIKILKLFPNHQQSDQIRAALGQNLTSKNIADEITYFQQAGRKSFERTYGWA